MSEFKKGGKEEKNLPPFCTPFGFVILILYGVLAKRVCLVWRQKGRIQKGEK